MTATPPAPTVTVLNDENPCPRVEVVVSPMPGDAAQLFIWRHWDGNRALVRGAAPLTVAGASVVLDYEAPLQTPVRYECQSVDVDGTPSPASPWSTPVMVSEPRVWLQDPLDPSSAFVCALARTPASLSRQPKAVFRRGSFGTVEHASTVTAAEVYGSDLPIGMGGVRQRPQQIPMDIRTTDTDTSDALRDLIRQAGVLLIRTGTRVPTLPTIAYVVLPSVTERFVYGPDVTVWSMTGQMVAPPTSPVLIAVRTLDELGVESDILDGLGDLYDTLLDLERGRNA